MSYLQRIIKSEIMFSFSKFLTTMLFALYMLASTQTSFAQLGEVGLRFMPTFSSFDAKSSDGGTISGEVTLGYGGGLLLGYHFNEYVGVQGEIIYTSISQKYKEQEKEHRVDLKYVNIPLMLSLNTGKTKLVNFNLVGGPQIGLSVGSKLTTEGDDGTTDSKAVLAVKKGDLGLAYGLGVDFGLNTAKTLRLGLGFRGVFGLFDISDNNNSNTTDSYYLLDRTKIQTYAGYLGVSYLF
jgi:hypothetical protein